jgi:hypothetical protein
MVPVLVAVAADVVFNEGKITKAVGGAVVDVLDFVVDEIIDPVVSFASNVIDSVLDDPIKAIAQVAAIATGNAWALPLIEGADVAIAGGDIGDVLKAVAVSYVAQNVGSYVGKTVSGAVSNTATAASYGVTAGSQQAAMLAAQEAGMQTASQIAGRVIGAGAASSAVAVVTGRDPVQAFLTGGVGAAVPAVLGQVDGFTKLPPSAQQVISQAVTTQLAGGNVTTAVIGSAIQASGIVTDIINKFDPDGTKMTDAQRAIAADVLMGSTTAALSGGNVPAAIQAALIKNGSKALGDMITDGFKSAVDSVSKKYGAAEKEADKLNANIEQQKGVAQKYNSVVEELNGRVAEQDRLKAEYDKAIAAQKANPSKATTDAANAAAKKYNDYVEKLNVDYAKVYQPQIDKYAAELSKIQTEYGNLEKVYLDAIKDFETATTQTKDTLKPVLDSSNRAFVEALDPKFNPDEYRKINNLGANVDVYEHWLSAGQFQGLKTNAAAAQADISTEKVRLVEQLAKEKGISLSQISNKDAQNFFARVDAKYGNNLAGLKQASIKDFLGGNVKSIDDLLKESTAEGFRVDVRGVAYGDWNKPKDYTPPDGMRLATAEEFANNTAVLNYTKDGKPVWVSQDRGVQVWDATINDYVYKPPVTVKATRLEDIKANDPESWLVMAGSIPGDSLGGIDDFLYNFAKSTMELANTTNNSTIINAAGNALKAGGGILESFNGLVVLANKNPKDTAVGKFAEKLTNLGKATTTAEYRAAVADMQKMMGSGSGIIGTGKAIWGAFTEHPTEFLAEIIGVEGMQELVPLMIGGGAAKVAQGLAIAKGMGTTVATQWATRAGLSAAAASDVAESIGGAASGAFEEAYRVATAQGMSEAQATQYALKVGARTGLTAGVITATTLGIGGAALEKAILGKAGTGDLAGVIDTLAKRIKDGGTITVKEGVVEGIEEGLSQAYLEGQLYKLDPNRDVAANITSSAILGAVAGGGVAGGAYGAATTGNVISNVLLSSNPTVANAVQNSTNAAAATKALSDLGISDVKLQAELLNSKYDAAYTSTAEARAALTARPDFVASDADISALVGNTSNANLAGAVEKYVDPRVFDIEEVKAAARAEGYEISNEEAAALVGQKDEASSAAAARKQFNPLATTYAEAERFLRAQGYNPTKAEVEQFVASKAETDQQTAIAEYVNPRQVTEAEARKYLTDLGYTPTDAEVKKFVGQVNEAEQAGKIGEYVDPLMVDEQEVLAAYEALGLKKPTQADVKKLIGQYAETDLTGRATENLDAARYNSIMEQLDTLAKERGGDPAALDIIKKDLNAQIEALGGDVAKLSGNTAAQYEALTAEQKALADKLTQQGVDLNTAIQTVQQQTQQQITEVEKSILDRVAQYEAAGMARDQALDRAVNDVAVQLGTTREDLLARIGETESALAGQITGVSQDLQTKYNALTDAQKDLTNKLTQQGVDLNTAIDTAKTQLQTQITDVQNTLGRPGAQATQDDLDTIINLLENQGAYNPNYDYNADGKIDQADKAAIERAITYQPDTDTPFAFTPAAGSKWAPTGLFATQAEEAERTRRAQAEEAERTRRAQAEAAQRTQRMGNVNTMLSMLMQAPDIAGQQVTVKAPDPAKIGYIYDFNSIFANPAQERMFVTPFSQSQPAQQRPMGFGFAQGGAVRSELDDVNDELLKMLKG